MKKNVKYIGGAVAAALLAAGSPVIVPRLISSETVQAADEGDPIDYDDDVPEDKSAYFQAFRDQYGTFSGQDSVRYVSSFKNLGYALSSFHDYPFDQFPYFNKGGRNGGGAYIYDFNHDDGWDQKSGFSLLKLYPNPNITFKDEFDSYIYRDVTAYVSIEDPASQNNPETDTHPAGAEELSTEPEVMAYAAKLSSGEIKSPIKLTVHLGTDFDETDYTPEDNSLMGLSSDLKTFSLIFYLSRLDLTSDHSNITTSVGATASDSELQKGDSTLKVTDNYSDTSDSSMSAIQTPVYGKSLFSSQEDALKAAENSNFDPNSTELGIAGGKTTTPNTTYYQTISYKLKTDGSDSEDMSQGDSALNYMISQKNDPKNAGSQITPYNTYIDNDATPKTEGKDYAINYGPTSTGYLTIVRPVKTTEGTQTAIHAQLDNPSVSVNSSSNIATTSDKLTDGTNPISTSSVTSDNKYYTTKDLETGTEATSDQIADGVFRKPGIYYRKLTFTLTNGKTSDYNISGDIQADRTDNTVTYIQEIDVKDAATLKVKEITPNVGADIATVNKNSAEDKGNSITNTTDTLGKSLIDTSKGDNGISFGSEYYTKGSTSDEKQAIIDGKGKELTNVSTDGKTFTKSGDYWRTITFYLTKEAIANNIFNSPDPNVKLSVENSTVMYVQQVHISANTGNKPVTVSTDVKNLAVKVNISDTDNALFDTEGYSLVDNSVTPNKNLVDTNMFKNGVKFGTDYFASDMKTPATGLVNGVFTKDGDYYRTVTFGLLPGFESYDFASIGGTLNSDGTVTFNQKITVSGSTVTPTKTAANENVKGTTVDNGTFVSSSTVSNPADVAITGKDGQSLVDSVKFGTSFYGSPADAQGAKNPLVTGGNLTSGGTYYQVVTVTLKPGIVDNYTFNSAATSDGNTLTYIRAVNVKSASSGNSGNSGSGNTNNNGNGSGDEDEWTYYKDPGVVTTKETEPSYTLNNRANNTVKNRALAENTSWLTDQYRTNRAGVKQYRVATNEWVDSNDVYFREQTTNNGTDDDWTYYKDPGIVTTKETEPSYTLNNRANNTVKNRALVENTSWITDQYRTNKEGVKQYRVATGEWIDSHDVYFVETISNTGTEDGWTYYKDPGVVRTVLGQTYYSLNNRANDTVKNRALAEQTSWLTDQYRTNKEGVKQYRVATNEWIDSHDVTYIKNIKGIVNVDETSSYYMLYNIDRELVKSRALEKQTSWIADKKAIDPDGNIYYRVTTNEWVEVVDGVYFDTYAWY